MVFELTDMWGSLTYNFVFELDMFSFEVMVRKSRKCNIRHVVTYVTNINYVGVYKYIFYQMCINYLHCLEITYLYFLHLIR